MRQLLAAALLAAASCAAAATGTPPSSVTAIYDVRRNNLHIAEVREQYEARDGAYRITSDSRALGAFALFQPRPARFESRGRIAGNGLRPDHFEAARGATDPRRVSAEFDWTGSRLVIRHDGQTNDLPLPAGTQDRLSILYQFMFVGSAMQRLAVFPMTNGRKLDEYRYTVTPRVEIDTPLGRLETVHLVKQRAPGDSGTEIWLSPRHHHLVVRMIVEDDGARYEQIATRLEARP